MKFSKELGQIFLRDKRYVRKIISSMNIEGKEVLEVGGCRGELTQYLLKKVKKLWCVELDSRLVEILSKRFSSFSNLEVINDDILKIDLSSFKRELVVFGNISYHISNKFIRYIITQRKWIKEVYASFQKEFAKKLTAHPGEKAYSFLTCYIQYFAIPKILFDIPKQAYWPQPRVDSSFVKIKFLSASLYPVEDEEKLFRVIKVAFRARRKKIINSLTSLYCKDRIKEVLEALGINEGERPDYLSLEDYCKIVNYLG
ncbi:MAG: ribosomal RNA small subunit methyltransferase A [Candidatus Omnitrophota bacterium]|nr:MAG: ribosomal RNA small subunit methyltransferase A [Candidatus Omnitrophota bacterium]